MARSSFMLIAALAVAASFTHTAAGQFPKIKLPRITITEASSAPTTREASSTPNAPESVNRNTDPSPPVPSGDVRGKPIPGAKITFSNNPDGSNPKTSFTSSEFIYGRLDLGGKTMYDAFGLKNLGDMKFYYIRYHLNILQPGKKAWEHDWHNGRTFTLVTKEDAQKTHWNFDVLPDPTKVSTLTSAIEDDLEFYKSGAGIYSKFYDADSARSTFPQNGTYTVDVTLFGSSYDDWGKPTGETENYPTASTQFAFQFSGTDGQALIANHKKARESLEASLKRRDMLRAMPDWWFKGATYPAEPKLSIGRLVPLIKGFIGQWNLTYLKHMIVKSEGPLWVIEKNSLGIPEYRMVKPYIYIAYKDPKDNSCSLGALYMRESYSGAGTYGAPYLGGIREVQPIDCAVIK